MFGPEGKSTAPILTPFAFHHRGSYSTCSSVWMLVSCVLFARRAPSAPWRTARIICHLLSSNDGRGYTQTHNPTVCVQSSGLASNYNSNNNITTTIIRRRRICCNIRLYIWIILSMYFQTLHQFSELVPHWAVSLCWSGKEDSTFEVFEGLLAPSAGQLLWNSQLWVTIQKLGGARTQMVEECQECQQTIDLHM